MVKLAKNENKLIYETSSNVLTVKMVVDESGTDKGFSANINTFKGIFSCVKSFIQHLEMWFLIVIEITDK